MMGAFHQKLMMPFFDTGEFFLVCANRIVCCQLLCNMPLIQTLLPKWTHNLIVKPSEEKNASIAMKLKAVVARGLKSFHFHYLQSKHLIQFQRISRYFYHRKYS
jgi:hypothetical protein